MLSAEQVLKINFEKHQNSLVPVVVQNVSSGKILMLAYANQEALAKTQESGIAHFFSRSRNQLWKKGETSGNFLAVEGIKIDCDGDALIYLVCPAGPACHTGEESCFFAGENISTDAEFLYFLEQLIGQRQKSMPADSYVTSLFSDGLDRIAQKVGEEAVETVIAAKNEDDAEFRSEAADLFFHLLILTRAKGVEFRQIIGILRERHSHK